jgi:predicted negative regulator of RcsB-dependent stress response
MAVYDLEEQEQIDELKAWWKQYGKLVIAAIAALLVGLAAVQGWHYYRQQQSLQAAGLYAEMKQALQDNDVKKAKASAGVIMDKFSSSGYAPMAALMSAKLSFDAGDLASAKAQLQWAIDHAREDELKDLARLRLAAVALDEKKYAEALQLLEAKHAESFDNLYADLKGDVFVAQGNQAEARAAYQTALDKSDAGSQYRGVIQLKMDALGDAK